MRKNNFILLIVALIYTIGCHQQETPSKTDDSTTNISGHGDTGFVIGAYVPDGTSPGDPRDLLGCIPYYKYSQEFGNGLGSKYSYDVTSEAFAVTRDGSKVLTTTLKFPAVLWDMKTGDPIFTLEQKHRIFDAVFSPNEKGILTVTTKKDDPVTLWNLKDGSRVAEYSVATPLPPITGLAPWIEELAKSTLWEFNGGRMGEIDVSLDKYDVASECGFVSVAFSPDGKELAAGHGNGTVVRWDTLTGKEIGRLTGTAPFPFRIRYSPDGSRLLTSALDGTVELWNMQTGKVVDTFRKGECRKGYYCSESPIDFSPDGKTYVHRVCVCASGEDRPALFLRESRTGKLIRKYSGNYGEFVFMPDGKSLLWAGSGLDIFDLEKGKAVKKNEELTRVPYFDHIHVCRLLPTVNACLGYYVSNGEDTAHQYHTIIFIVPFSEFGQIEEEVRPE